MKKTSATEILHMFETQNVANRADFTYEEFLEQLIGFQKIVSTCVFDGNETFHLSDSITQIQQFIRDKELTGNPLVHQTIEDLKKVNKELAISFAGKKGEKRIAKTLAYVQRSDLSVFKNVYITDGEEETELDNVLVTKNGLIILEIKNTKQDITISEDGRLLYDNEISYHNVSIGEKMEKKRRLLRFEIENEMKKRGVDLFGKPIRIESRVVFSTPYKTYITVTDLFKKERFCYKNQLTKQIENYYSGTCYESDELQLINDIIGSMECNKKRFQQKLDFAIINNEFAELMEMLSKTEQVKSTESLSPKADETLIQKSKQLNRHKKKTNFQTVGKIAISAASVALILARVISKAAIAKKV